MARHKRQSTVFVEPDLPITPMLDMSFQLMAFFLIVFNPTPPEGHLDLALPKQSGGPSTQIPITQSEEEDDLTVVVTATPEGGIANISVATKTSPDPKMLGADSAKLFEFLKGRQKDVKPGKLALQMSENIGYAFVVKLIDESSRAGYKQVSPTVIGAK